MPTYWESRKHLTYYRSAVETARRHAPDSTSMLDVGGGLGCQYLRWFSWIRDRWVIDLRRLPEIPGVNAVAADFMGHDFGRRFDLVTCLQVLEHLESPEEFCRRLIQTTGQILVVSVPYRWPEGSCKYHLQDPVDEEKLNRWMGIRPVEQMIVRDGLQRLVATYDLREPPPPR